MNVYVKEFTKGLWTDIPPFRFVLGLCPTLAVSTSVKNGIGMGIAATFVLVCSNAFISALRKIIPDEVRVACYIVIAATFVVVVDLMMQAYSPPLSESLGIFIPLIVVNCIILGRAEAFAKKNGVVLSILDGLGMGTGWTMALCAVGLIREVFGKGVIPFTDIQVIAQPFHFLQEAPGAFVTLGLMLGIMNVIGKK